jgi:hypothetical protein
LQRPDLATGDGVYKNAHLEELNAKKVAQTAAEDSDQDDEP